MDKPDKTQLKPTGDWIVVEQLEVSEKTVGGILMPLQNSKIEKYGKVLKIGPGHYQNGEMVSPSVKVGDTIMFRSGRGLNLRLGGEEVLFMTERDLLAIISRVG